MMSRAPQGRWPGPGGAAARAAVMRAGLNRLWGDELPPASDPLLAALTDAVVVDDEAGVEDGLVVRSDCLTVDALARLVMGTADAEERLRDLPEALRARVAVLLLRTGGVA